MQVGWGQVLKASGSGVVHRQQEVGVEGKWCTGSRVQVLKASGSGLVHMLHRQHEGKW